MPRDVQHEQLHGTWRDALNREEKQRVKELDAREARKIETLAELRAERRRIMQRAIRRQRRKAGKD